MTTPTIPLCVPSLGDDERRLLGECLDSTFVSSVGPFVTRFESEFAARVGSQNAVACASGTAAIHLALRAIGVGRGDLVLCQDFTFIASVTPAVHLGAEVGFIDSEPRSWNLDPALTAQALDDCVRTGRRPKALIAVHILGQPADLGPIVDACARHGVALIEDAAEALGAGWTTAYPHPACAGRQVGTVGAVGCFSFNGNKVITTGGGGMAVTADAKLAETMKHLSTQAKLPGLGFVHDQVGYNYRLPNLNAALGLAQLGRLDGFLARKHAIAQRYRAVATRLGWTWQPQLAGSVSSDWLASCLVGADSGRTRDRILAHLTAHGIQARPLWLPLARQPCLAGSRRWGGAVGDRLAAEGLSLPCSTGISEVELERVCAALESHETT